MLFRPFLKGIVWGLLLAVIGLGAAYYRPDLPVDVLRDRYAYPESKFVTVQDMPVHYRVTGQGPDLLLLHGTGASLHTWAGWHEQLQDSFRVISLDLPAFGLTGPHPEGDYSISAYVAFLEAFAKKITLDSFHLAGNSLGGLIAWSYAATHPERITKLILVDASGFPRNKPTPLAIRLARYPVVSHILRYVTPKPLFRQTLSEVYGDPEAVAPETVDRYYQLFQRTGNRQAYIERARETHKVPTGPLRELNVPTLILWGEQDRWIPPEHADQFDAFLPDSRVILYPGLGHVPMEEAPERTALDVRRFLQESGSE